jgi:hypothetical protein
MRQECDIRRIIREVDRQYYARITIATSLYMCVRQNNTIEIKAAIVSGLYIYV